MKFIKRLLMLALICIIMGAGTIFGFYKYVESELPDVATLRDVELQTPMQIYSRDGKLISQFGEKKRIPVKLEDMPQDLLNAIIATEDSRYYQHFGFDPIGIARAAVTVVASGSAKQGASTITQQLARNFFLTNEKKIMRKVKEIFIAVHIENLLTKDEILELYLNKIYLGHRSYGVGAAAQTYFGKDLAELDLSELALIAGLPKAPSTVNPIYSLPRATHRRNVVLIRMLDENYITQQQYDEARAQTLISNYHGAEIELSAPYVAEVARAWMVERYGDDAYTSGMKVYTSIDSRLQNAANDAAINNLLAYDERHGYRGAEKVVWQENAQPLSQDAMVQHLRREPIYGKLSPAIVTNVDSTSATVWIKNQGEHTINWDGIRWAREYRTDKRQGSVPKAATDVLTAGEQVWVRRQESTTEQEATSDEAEHIATWQLSQVPAANTAFVAMNPDDGAVVSMVGGFNFVHNKFNRATQSVRQVGSSIKPFIYSAAIDKGLTLASLINDAPINQWDKSQGTAWRPKNSPPTYTGPTRLRIGLAQSKNVMAVRVLRSVGLNDSRNFLTRFGFEISQVPRSETIALGAGSLTPIQMAQGYSVFANGGYFVEPYFIEHIETPYGEIEYQAQPSLICKGDCEHDVLANEFQEQDIGETSHHYAPQVISAENAFLVREMMYSNVWGGGNWGQGTGWNGTGWRAQKLNRRDIGGKTGTTNDSKDAWYNGFAPGLVATSWVGFDNHSRTLGSTTANSNLDKNPITGGESGAKTALPAWVSFMDVALNQTPAQAKSLPENIVRVRIDRETGLLTNKSDSSTMFEYFEKGTEPTQYQSDGLGDSVYSSSDDGEELF